MIRLLGAISLAAVLVSSLAFGQSYPYPFTDPFSSESRISPNWQTHNGAALTVGTSAGLTTTDANGGSLIYNGSGLDNSSNYEGNATLKLTQSGSNDAYGLDTRPGSVDLQQIQ